MSSVLDLYKKAKCNKTRPNQPPPSAAMRTQRAHPGSSPPVLEPKSLGINPDYAVAHRALISSLVLMALFASVGAVDLPRCGTRLKAEQQRIWNATNGTSPPPGLNLTYQECLVECGRGIGDIRWAEFSQSFAAWFLPWLALTFQIPFGAECV